jgi:succinate--hydroxymethylglutarate CoA-transferase
MMRNLHHRASAALILSAQNVRHRNLKSFKANRRPHAETKGPETNPGALKGVRILDFTRILAGPFCSQILADYGADVIKVESLQGDETRSWQGAGEAADWKDSSEPMSFYFASINRNKRSITLDLKKPEALDVVYELAKTSDVVIENFVPGSADRLGIGYAKLSEVNPRLVYASVSGYGGSGPYGKRAGYDAIAAAEGGLMHVTGHPDGPPMRPGLGMTDMATGLYTHGAIVSALYSRDRTGQGQHISSSLFETQISLLINIGANWLNRGVEGKRYGAAHPSIVPYNTWECKDGLWLAVAANNDRQFRILCERLRCFDLLDDKRFATNAQRVEHRPLMDEIFDTKFKAKSSEEWLKVLEGSGLAFGSVNTIQKAFEHPQTQARDMVQPMEWHALQSGLWQSIAPPVKFEKSKAAINSRPPLLGEHTEEILGEIGYSKNKIEDLQQRNIV